MGRHDHSPKRSRYRSTSRSRSRDRSRRSRERERDRDSRRSPKRDRKRDRRSNSPDSKHETKLSRDLEEKTIVEETAKRIESYVQKRVRQELESESFLITLQKKIDEAKKALTDKMLAGIEKEVEKEVHKEKQRRLEEALAALPPPPPPPDDAPPLPPLPPPDARDAQQGAGHKQTNNALSHPHAHTQPHLDAHAWAQPNVAWAQATYEPAPAMKILPPPPPGDYDAGVGEGVEQGDDGGEMDIEEQAAPPKDAEVDKAEREEEERQRRLADLEEKARKAEELRRQQEAEKEAHKQQQKLILGNRKAGGDKMRPKLSFGLTVKK